MELPLLGLLIAFVTGCVSPTPSPRFSASDFPPANVPPPATASSPAAAPPQPSAPVTAIAPPGRLGHYSSGDGRVGLVLDRLGKTPKILIDGTADVIDFEPQGKTADHTDFVNPKAHVFMRFEANGRVTFSHGAFDGTVTRDAGAASLRGGLGNSNGNVNEQASSTTPKLRLGHYSSGDGMTGFVLDRTGVHAKLRMDEDADVLELDSELSLRGRGVVVRFGDHGEVTYFTGNESIAMRRDADAAPL